MARLLRRSFPVFPQYGLLRLLGPGACPTTATTAAQLDGALLSGGDDHIELSTLQGRIDVRVILEEWNAAPPPPRNTGWEEDASTTVFLREYVTVGGGAPGYTVSLRLRGGARLYRADVHAWGRHEVAQRYDQLLRWYDDPQSVSFRAEERRLCGREEFLIRLRPATSTDATGAAGARHGGLCRPRAAVG